jgi:hypothetical protein
MSVPVSIITPSFHRDLESCRLLCDTLDRHATGYTDHYIVVTSDDLPLFAPLAGPRRHVVSERDVLQAKLYPIPIRWRGRRYRWLPGAWPVYGWHIQQVLKFAMTLAQPNPRVMFIDSDNFLVRPFDIAAFGGGPTLPLQLDRGAIVASEANHVTWLRTAHELLGLERPNLPADDYIGNMIVWDKQIVREILHRIEAKAGVPWWVALMRARPFSEYLIYGTAVSTDPKLMARHHAVTAHPCLTYWEGPALDEASFHAFASRMRPDQSALGVQSFTGTSIELLRSFALRQKELA